MLGKIRAITSVLPPAANGTMIVGGLDRHLSCAGAAATDKPSVMAATRFRREYGTAFVSSGFS